MKRTKIVCTIGPATESKAQLKKLIKAGMNVARLNMSHGEYEWHIQTVKNVRAAAKETKQNVAILLDLQGPKIRLGKLPEKGVKITQNQKITLKTGKEFDPSTPDHLPVNFSKFADYVAKGSTILFDDGLMDATVLKVVKNGAVTAKINTGGILKSNKGINLPDNTKTISSLTKKDKEDIIFAVKQEVDYIALSFVQSARDITTLKKLIALEEAKKQKLFTPTKVIAKIEKKQAIENIDAIIEKTDAIMIARGDLGIETSLQDVPIYQKQIIEKCLRVGKPAIVATQMLDSMTTNPRPTRAEVSDVANAVIDHADAVMLSQESAVGKYPIKTVETMTSIIQDTEKSQYDDLMHTLNKTKNISVLESLARSAIETAYNIKADAVIMVTCNATSVQQLVKFRPELPMIVTTNSERKTRQLSLLWGVVPVEINGCMEANDMVKIAVKKGIEQKIIQKGQTVVIVGTEVENNKQNVDFFAVHKI